MVLTKKVGGKYGMKMHGGRKTRRNRGRKTRRVARRMTRRVVRRKSRRTKGKRGGGSCMGGGGSCMRGGSKKAALRSYRRRVRRSKCRGKGPAVCRSMKKCKYASKGKKRTFCRKRKNTHRN